MNSPSKYHSIRTEYGGEMYDSKAEAQHAGTLDLLKKAVLAKERVLDWCRQIPVPLAAGIEWRVDFVVLYADLHHEIHEVKGFQTRDFKMKLKLFKDKYPDIIVKIIEA